MKFRYALSSWAVLSAVIAAEPAAPAKSAAPPPPPNTADSLTPAIPEAPVKKESQWVFELLPKAFQKNPRLELTVITEMTDAGRQRPAASRTNPAYFEPYSAGFRQLGHAPANEHTLQQTQIEQLLTRSLATNGYLRAQPPTHPPSILIIYTWGSHNLLVEGDDENPTLSANQVARNILDRAALVGGEKFAKHLLELFEQADSMSLAASAPTPPGGNPVITPALQDFMNPVSMFKRASVKNEFLLDQTASDVYYVVASAYDYRSAASKTRVLLWRTRMTVAAQGVSQEQSLPTLVLSAAPFFGKDMPEPEILSKRSVPEGKVEVGTPTVVDPSAPKGPKSPKSR